MTSGFFWRHPLVLSLNLEYYWRVEPDVRYFCELDYDPFLYMKQNKKKYGKQCVVYKLLGKGTHTVYTTQPSIFHSKNTLAPLSLCGTRSRSLHRKLPRRAKTTFLTRWQTPSFAFCRQTMAKLTTGVISGRILRLHAWIYGTQRPTKSFLSTWIIMAGSFMSAGEMHLCTLSLLRCICTRTKCISSTTLATNTASINIALQRIAWSVVVLAIPAIA